MRTCAGMTAPIDSVVQKERGLGCRDCRGPQVRPVLREDPPDLADDGGMILAEVAGRDARLGRDPFEMGTLVRYQAVAPAGCGRVAPVRDDGMGRDVRREPEPIQTHEDQRSPVELVDARGEALAEALGEEVRAIAGDEPPVRGLERVGQADEPGSQALQLTPVDQSLGIRGSGRGAFEPGGRGDGSPITPPRASHPPSGRVSNGPTFLPSDS